MTIPLEDTLQDILGKAMRGLGLDAAALAARTGTSLASIAALLANDVEEPALASIAPALGLYAPSLLAIARGTWHPGPISAPGLTLFRDTEDAMVPNAFLLAGPGSGAVLFDTTTHAAPAIIAAVRQQGLALEAICITHTHRDHVAALPELLRAFPQARVAAPRGEPLPGAALVAEGEAFTAAGHRIEPRLVAGHSPGQTAYVVHGAAMPLAAVGDALFAGSMGGGKVSWADALANNRRSLFSLPDTTIICPGHGPLTTVALEKAHNPFYPEFKRFSAPPAGGD